MKIVFLITDTLLKDTLTNLLSMNGMTAVDVSLGESNKKNFKSNQFDLIITDDVVETERHIEKNKNKKQTTPFYVLAIVNSNEALNEQEYSNYYFIAKEHFLNYSQDVFNLVTSMVRLLRVKNSKLKVLETTNLKLEDQRRQIQKNLTYSDAANHRFAELFQSIPIACFCYDENGLIFDWNRASETLYGKQNHEVFQQNIWDILYPYDDKQNAMDVFQRVFSGEMLERWETTHVGPDNTFLNVLASSIPLRNAEGVVVAAITAVVDVTELKLQEAQINEQMLRINAYNLQLENQKLELERANSMLEVLATTDGLTGIKNHRAFQERLSVVYDEAVKNTKELSVILLDVDFFKKFNDTFGHIEGDRVLRKCAGLVQDSVRDTDFAARYGGEEFVVILPDTDYKSSKAVAERIRARIENASWEQRTVTVSLGVSTYKEEITNKSELIAEADRALYHSKARGRNRTTHANDVPKALENQRNKTKTAKSDKTVFEANYELVKFLISALRKHRLWLKSIRVLLDSGSIQNFELKKFENCELNNRLAYCFMNTPSSGELCGLVETWDNSYHQLLERVCKSACICEEHVDGYYKQLECVTNELGYAVELLCLELLGQSVKLDTESSNIEAA